MSQPEAHSRLAQRRQAFESFNVLVAGPRGVGKSTLLQTLCDSLHDLQITSLSEADRDMFAAGSGIAEEVLDPFCVFDTLSGTTHMRRCCAQSRDPVHGSRIRIELIDTPGIDPQNAAAQINEISWEIERRLQAALDEELSVRRGRAARAALVHAVVYVVAPPVYSSATTDAHCHRLDAAADILTETDVAALRQLASLTNVLVAVGKSDSIEASDRALLKDRSFFADASALIAPARLFAFEDLPGTQQEPTEEVRAFGHKLQRRLPFLLCGSKHVDEWQQMRLPEYQASSRSRLSISDWRALESPHNRIRPAAVTRGIFRRADSPSVRTSSATSLPTASNTVAISRLHQRREIALVREFPWGALQLNNPAHCDFALLSDVLLTSFRRSLVCWADEHFYESYRMRRMAADPAYSGATEALAACVSSTPRQSLPCSGSAANTLCQPPSDDLPIKGRSRRYSATAPESVTA
ncbi:hypothetical protein LPJ68_001813 [Coemansia sp. RSA 1086]|nr:hypothetical protein LPJ68_001813 [Coemansia sp. RSA 1086]